MFQQISDFSSPGIFFFYLVISMKLLQDFKIPPNLQFCFDICFSFLQKLIRGSEKQAVPPVTPHANTHTYTHTHTHTLQILVFLSFGLLKTHKRSRSLECKSYFFHSILRFRLLCSEWDGGGGGRVLGGAEGGKVYKSLPGFIPRVFHWWRPNSPE